VKKIEKEEFRLPKLLPHLKPVRQEKAPMLSEPSAPLSRPSPIKQKIPTQIKPLNQPVTEEVPETL